MSGAPTSKSAQVGIVMGSDSDWPTMRAAADALDEFGVPFEADVISAHRMPHEMLADGAGPAGRGLRVVIAGAGGAAHLPGMLASATPLPVIGVPVPLAHLDGLDSPLSVGARAPPLHVVGVPVPLAHLDGLDSLLSIVQMPTGVPVATVSIGGARNAGLLAVRIRGSSDRVLRERVESFQA